MTNITITSSVPSSSVVDTSENDSSEVIINVNKSPKSFSQWLEVEDSLVPLSTGTTPESAKVILGNITSVLQFQNLKIKQYRKKYHFVSVQNINTHMLARGVDLEDGNLEH